MKNLSQSAMLEWKKFSESFTYRDTVVLTFDIDYPKITMPDNIKAAERINSVINAEVAAYYRTARGSLYKDAVDGYIYATQNGYPFNAYNSTVKYEVTLNADCALSMYRDAYVFAGGAHGNTLRKSDTFSLKSGSLISLAGLFPKETGWRYKLLDSILRQAEQNMFDNPHIYFDNYRELILKYFDPNSFYLTEKSIVIYYQQYEIGPYAIGIQTFDIPYQSVNAVKPSCLG